MSFEFARPEVKGVIDADLLALLAAPGYKCREGASYDAMSEELWPLYDEMARIADVTLDTEHQFVGRSSTVEPRRSQDERAWHYDRVEGFVVADEIPTEILVGDEEVVLNFWKNVAGKGISLGMDTFTEQQIMTDFRRATKWISDDKLKKKYGFTVWSPEPLEVIPLVVSNLHRSQKNTTKSALRRNYAMFFELLPRTY